jgi:hypothetical protein
MNAVYPTARPAIWPGRQYTNLLRIPQAEHPVVSAYGNETPMCGIADKKANY